MHIWAVNNPIIIIRLLGFLNFYDRSPFRFIGILKSETRNSKLETKPNIKTEYQMTKIQNEKSCFRIFVIVVAISV